MAAGGDRLSRPTASSRGRCIAGMSKERYLGIEISKAAQLDKLGMLKQLGAIAA